MHPDPPLDNVLDPKERAVKKDMISDLIKLLSCLGGRGEKKDKKNFSNTGMCQVLMEDEGFTKASGAETR